MPIVPPPDDLPRRVRVVLSDGQRIPLEDPRIEGPSIRGDITLPIPLTEIRSAEAEVLSVGRTLSFVTASAVVGGIIFFLMTFEMNVGSGGTIGWGG
jgi:hypothetical protein